MWSIILLLSQRDHFVHVKQLLPPLVQVWWVWNKLEPLELSMVRQLGIIPVVQLAYPPIEQQHAPSNEPGAVGIACKRHLDYLLCQRVAPTRSQDCGQCQHTRRVRPVVVVVEVVAGAVAAAGEVPVQRGAAGSVSLGARVVQAVGKGVAELALAPSAAERHDSAARAPVVGEAARS